jgi:DNA-binding transcriptional regulator GbsR (MarR family)
MSVIKAPTAPRKALRPTEHQFVEKLAVAMETDGFPRIAGRIFSLLIISDGELSLDEIVEVIGASKASVSTNTRLLEEKGLIERTSRPADRRDYYRIVGDVFLKTMEQRLAKWNRVRTVVSEAIQDGSLSASARGRLKEFEADSDSMRELLEASLVKLRNRRKK